MINIPGTRPPSDPASLQQLIQTLLLLTIVALGTTAAHADSDVELSGTADGSGSVEVILDGVNILVTTTAGDTPDILASSLASAINGDPTLQGLGTTATAIGNQVTSNGVFSDGWSTDAGVRLSLAPGRVLASQKISDTSGSFTGILNNQDLFGASVASLGYLDGDGVPDLVAGTPQDDDGGSGSDRGALWVLFLDTDGTVKTHQKISDTKGGFTGTLANNDNLGASVTSPGDLDGDDVPDLVAGASLDDDGGTASDRGALWVLFLNASGTVKTHQKISDTTGGFTGTLDDADYFGSSVTSPGDLDGDDVPDLVVGAPADDDGGTDRGALWVLFLNADGTVKAHQKISDTTGGFTGALDDSDYFGWSVASLGDLDGDGVEDVAAGARGDDDGGTARGALWVLFLNADGTVKAHQKISDTTGGFTGVLDDFDNFGNSIAPLGDLDGDGMLDLATGARGDDDGGSTRGALWVLFLNTDGTVKAHQKISDTTGGFTGVLDDGDAFSNGIASPGDLDGDGLPDLAANALFDDDGGTDRGAIWMLFLDGTAAICGDAILTGAEQCDDGNLTGGDGCSAVCTTESWLQIFGDTAGGAVSFMVEDVPLSIATTDTLDLEQVADAIAAEINNDASLAILGITALTDGNTVYTNAALSGLSTTDPGLILRDGTGAAPRSDGDINLDGSVDLADIMLGYRVLGDQASLSPTQESHGDVAPLSAGVPAPDGAFNLGDVLLIQRKVLGAISY